MGYIEFVVQWSDRHLVTQISRVDTIRSLYEKIPVDVLKDTSDDIALETYAADYRVSSYFVKIADGAIR